MWKAARTELNICRVSTCRNLTMARSRRWTGRCELPTLLRAQRPTGSEICAVVSATKSCEIVGQPENLVDGEDLCLRVGE